MQTFLPHPDFMQSAYALDNKRLGKQRVEAIQILNVLQGVDMQGNPKDHKGWVNHPAVLMWKGYELALLKYGTAMCSAWIERGFKDSIRDIFFERSNEFDWNVHTRIIAPHWLGIEKFHHSHIANLIRKDPEYYSLTFGTMFGFDFVKSIDINTPYWWPTKELNESNSQELAVRMVYDW